MSIGAAVGAYLDPEKFPGPKLTEAPAQTGRESVPIVIIWGTHETHGNIIADCGYEDVETWHRKGKTKVSEHRRYRTFAIGVCRGPNGPIDQYLRIWEADKLVYDARDVPDIPWAESLKFLESTRFYLGDGSQMPDPDLEAHYGVGHTAAHRGLAYMVKFNYDVTDFGGAIPQYRFEVLVGRTGIITTLPYPEDE
jgi:hypothetical protein